MPDRSRNTCRVELARTTVRTEMDVANTYLPRVIDSELDELLMAVPALSVEGVRGVGKTATCLRRAKASYSLEDVNVRAALNADLRALDRQPRPVLIDEWQRLPQTWDYVRQSVDNNPELGQFLLTGSANPPTAPKPPGDPVFTEPESPHMGSKPLRQLSGVVCAQTRLGW